jgi:succinate dehydrogenase / fumarate reductase cytochrome b subunit
MPRNELLFLYRFSGYYHAANGVRIMLIDFWPAAYRYERQLFYGVMAVFLLAFIPTAFLMIRAIIQAG